MKRAIALSMTIQSGKVNTLPQAQHGSEMSHRTHRLRLLKHLYSLSTKTVKIHRHNTYCARLIVIVMFGFGAIPSQAHGDALVVTKAMQASTIAQLFIDSQGVRVELEIAPADMEVFQNLLPDSLYAALGQGTTPLAERSQRFFRDGLLLRDQSDSLLEGSIEHMEIRRRIVRDEVTGEPLSEQPLDTELVLYVVLKFTFGDRPTSLTIQPPLLTDSSLSAANIGFVCYHNGLPVNDFRYLPGEVSLDLDWSDPWYSRFQHPNLRRQFDAPMSVFLYVEPYEVRKEIIVRPKDLEAWVDLGVGEGEVIPVDRQAELKERVAEFLSTKNPLTIDGRTVEGQLDRIHFIHRTLRRTGIVEPPVELDAASATLGVIFVYPVSELPEEVSMTWELFSPQIQEIPAVASDEAGGLPSRITPENAVFTWRNYLTNPTTPGMVTIEQPQRAREFSVPIVSAICSGLLVLSLAILARQWTTKNAVSRRAVCASLAALLCGVLSLPLAQVVIADPFTDSPRIMEEDATDLITGLLYNIYRAFDHHDESLIYDRLSQSIAGDLLAEVYLNTRKSMEVKNQGGLRVSVKEVTVSELESVGLTDGPAYSYRCRWRVAGSIGHWGHVHRRVNEHLALVTLAPLDGRWKITALEMLDERPLLTTAPSMNPGRPAEARL